MNIAPVSSRRLEIRPLKRAVKKESGTHVNVCRDVENLKTDHFEYLFLSLNWFLTYVLGYY